MSVPASGSAAEGPGVGGAGTRCGGRPRGAPPPRTPPPAPGEQGRGPERGAGRPRAWRAQTSAAAQGGPGRAGRLREGRMGHPAVGREFRAPPLPRRSGPSAPKPSRAQALFPRPGPGGEFCRPFPPRGRGYCSSLSRLGAQRRKPLPGEVTQEPRRDLGVVPPPSHLGL